MNPFKNMLRTGDYSFMDGHASPLHSLGLYGAWVRMHDITKSAVMEYVLNLASLSGMFDDTLAVQAQNQPNPEPAAAGIAQDMHSFDPAMMTRLFNIARTATMSLTDEDARDLLEGRNSKRLGDMCFGIMDSLAAPKQTL